MGCAPQLLQPKLYHTTPMDSSSFTPYVLGLSILCHTLKGQTSYSLGPSVKRHGNISLEWQGRMLITNSSALRLPKKVNPRRISNKVKRTPYCLKRSDAEDPKLFDLTCQGYRLPDPVVDEGSDQGMGSENDPGNHDSDDDLNSKLSMLWRQFLVDLTAKAPNQRSADLPSYCKLSEEERLKVDDKVYKNRKLSDYWVDCQWKIATEQEWTLNFNRLWPDKNDTLYGNTQNYKSTTYYLQWKMLIFNSEATTVYAIREQIRKRFNGLYWLPHAQTDRIWHTKFLKGFTRSNNINKSNLAPRVLINWTAMGRPTW